MASAAQRKDDSVWLIQNETEAVGDDCLESLQASPMAISSQKQRRKQHNNALALPSASLPTLNPASPTQAASGPSIALPKATTVTARNEAATFAAAIMQSQMAQTSGTLWIDYQLLTTGHAIYLPNFLCPKNDFSLLQRLSADLEKNAGAGMINWSQHLKHENPDFSDTFREIVSRMADYFDCEVFATRLNFYPDQSSWKPFHHDSHAYAGKNRKVKEDFTMGASFGATRELVFMHPPSQQQFSFPQSNGDIFAFTTTVNQKFMHGVPKASKGALASSAPAPRFSIIAWGRRRTLNERNAGKDEIGTRLPEDYDTTDDGLDNPKNANPSSSSASAQPEKEQAMSITQVTDMVQKFIISATPPPPAAASTSATTSTNPSRNRVQGGWAAPPPSRGGWGRGGGRGGGGGGGWGQMKKSSGGNASQDD